MVKRFHQRCQTPSASRRPIVSHAPPNDDRGVRVTLADGSRLLIGSQRPEDLAAVLSRVEPPEVG